MHLAWCGVTYKPQHWHRNAQKEKQTLKVINYTREATPIYSILILNILSESVSGSPSELIAIHRDHKKRPQAVSPYLAFAGKKASVKIHRAVGSIEEERTDPRDADPRESED
jgi:hypothetical protein